MSRRTYFSLWLRHSRETLGLSIEELAQTLGCPPDQVRALEDGTDRPDRPQAEVLAHTFSVPAAELAAFILFATTDVDSALDPAEYDEDGKDGKDGIDPEAPWRVHARPPSNLPAQLTSLVGRTADVERVATMLRKPDVRLLTLLGPPGIGKTRLSIEVAAHMLDEQEEEVAGGLGAEEFEDGVFFVPLAAVSNPALAMPAIAAALDITETSNRSTLDTLKDVLHDKHMLLVLDNLEQVIGIGPALVDLLSTCYHLKILCTSRAALHVYGEQVTQVPALPTPRQDELPTAGSLSRWEAAHLFIQRARSADSSFQLDDEAAGAIAEIVRRLDGLPLAIELAAARTRLLSPANILSRLDHRLSLLVGGASNLPPRQQTLRGAIDWSYNLLDEQEKVAFRCLSVFTGGCTLEAAEAILAEPSAGQEEDDADSETLWSESEPTADPLEMITAMLDKSLVKQEQGPGGEGRLIMLETLREYGVEQLTATGEATQVRRRHAELMTALAEQAEPYLTSPDRDPWLSRLDADIDNIRAALTWSLSKSGDPEIGLRLAGALGWYWYYRGSFVEGRKWLADVLAKVDHAHRTLPLAKALYASGKLAEQHFDLDVARPALQESVSIFRELGERRLLAYALVLLARIGSHMANRDLYSLADEGQAILVEIDDRWGLAHALDLVANIKYQLGDVQGSVESEHRSLDLYRQLGDTLNVAYMLCQLGLDAVQLRDFGLAHICFTEAIPLTQEVGDHFNLGHVLYGSGMLAHLEGEYERAEAFYQECLALYQSLGDQGRVAYAMRHLGYAAYRRHRYDKALTFYKEALKIFRELQRIGQITACLAAMGGIAADSGDLQLAATLLGLPLSVFADGLNSTNSTTVDAAEYERMTAQVRAKLGDTEFEEKIAEGQGLSLDQGLLTADRVRLPDGTTPQKAAQPKPHAGEKRGAHESGDLSKREVELLRLVALGLSNAQLASRLFLSPNTVRAHLYSIYNKINVTSRTAAIHYASVHGIL